MRSMLPAVLAITLVLLPTLGTAATIHVPGDQPTIQAGIDVAAAGDTILVACGTYTWYGEATGDSLGLIRMKPGVCLRSETGEASSAKPWRNYRGVQCR